jgi:hypothetical protein
VHNTDTPRQPISDKDFTGREKVTTFNPAPDGPIQGKQVDYSIIPASGKGK